MQATLAVVAAALGSSPVADPDWRWLAGAAFSLANWPYTFLAVMPTNKRLMATPVEAADAEARRLIEVWGRHTGPRRAGGGGHGDVPVGGGLGAGRDRGCLLPASHH